MCVCVFALDQFVFYPIYRGIVKALLFPYRWGRTGVLSYLHVKDVNAKIINVKNVNYTNIFFLHVTFTKNRT